MASCVQIPRAIGAFYHVWKWHNVQRARSEMRRCTTYALYRSKLEEFSPETRHTWPDPCRWHHGPLKLEEFSPETRYTRPDPCRWHHGRPNCDLSTGFSWLLPQQISDIVILRTGAVVESAQAHRLSSISENVTNLARAGRMTYKVKRDFEIITHELSRVLRQFHWLHRTFWDLRFVLQNLYIRKQVRRFWQSWKQGSKQVRQKFRKYQPVITSLSQYNCQERVNSRLSPTPVVATKKKGEEEHNETNFSNCNYCSASE